MFNGKLEAKIDTANARINGLTYDVKFDHTRRITQLEGQIKRLMDHFGLVENHINVVQLVKKGGPEH